MKVLIELEEGEELEEFLRWRRMMRSKEVKARQRANFDAKHGRTELALLGWPAPLLRQARNANIETLEQANAANEMEWLKTSGNGRKGWHQLQELLAAVPQHKSNT